MTHVPRHLMHLDLKEIIIEVATNWDTLALYCSIEPRNVKNMIYLGCSKQDCSKKLFEVFLYKFIIYYLFQIKDTCSE